MIRKLFSGLGTSLHTPTGVIVTANLILVAAAWLVGIRAPLFYIISILILGFDIFVSVTLQDRLIHFFAQFVLPIQNPEHREEIATRVKNFEGGRRGPAMFVKNGRMILHKGEAKKRGPGLIVLDTASALVLRTDTEIKDTVGPGIKFTKGNEYVAGSVDLRAQWQFIGPLATDQPFLNPISSPKEYNESLGRRQRTNGWTRDGFEISPTISIRFSVKRPGKKAPNESGVTSYYGFDPEAVRNAVVRQFDFMDAEGGGITQMDWDELPAHLVVNIWREYIRKFKFDELFSSREVDSPSGLQTIEEAINQRVKKSHVDRLDDTGLRHGDWAESLEYKQLQAHGLEIMDVRIHKVLFDEALEKRIIDQWNTEWYKSAAQEERHLKEMEGLNETAGRIEAGKLFATTASQKFSGKTTLPQDNHFKTLQLLIEPLKEFILNQRDDSNSASEEERKLEEIWKWLLDNTSTQPEAPASGGRK
jgi:hypothetical protein